MQTQTSSAAESELTIATRVGSASALKRAASSSDASRSRGATSGPQQRGWRTGSACIDRYQCIIRPTPKGGRNEVVLRRLLQRRLVRMLLGAEGGGGGPGSPPPPGRSRRGETARR